jgi:2-polyprenyl-6-methoxyphenol hydroxylase-like FAD-dependent oxidoreductase
MITSPVLIAGARIGGLSVALTLHQIGVSCVVFESVADIKPVRFAFPKRDKTLDAVEERFKKLPART